MSVKLTTSLDVLKGVGSQFSTKLKRLGIETISDLLYHFPTRYEDYSQVRPIEDLVPGENVTVSGTVHDISGRRAWRRRMFIVEALITDDTGSIRAVWFNQPYIRNILGVGRRVNLAGKVAQAKDGEIYLSNPTYEVVREYGEETTHTARIVAIYPETRGFTSKGIRHLVAQALESLEPLEEVIPHEVLEQEKLPDITTALNHIHFPETIEDALAAKRRFAFEDLYLLQLVNVRERMLLAREKAPVIRVNAKRLTKAKTILPFTLTQSQEQAIEEICTDLRKGTPMNRFLQGDVGSGKTVVAALAALETAENGYQVTFMAPTELLARQHYHTITKLFPKFERGIALLTASESRVWYGHELESIQKKAELQINIAKGNVRMVIGTHALLEKRVSFHSLGLVVIDEQHRFGVRQRATLLQSKMNRLLPHFLSMSATPIPRTLSLTLFGNLDLSLITELPKGRKEIITKVVAPTNREKAYAFIRGCVQKGRQVFVICPRIEPQDPALQTELSFLKFELKSVTEEYEKLSKKIFPDLRVAMLHGKMKAKEKGDVMREFAEGKYDILTATSVVEVGVDVPNATVMMIESTERFGLAQIYQFRGRVGRGKHQSFCFLFTESTSSTVRTRLKALVEAKNGFELAEQDLKIRGPGEFLGNSQTGMPDLAMKAIQNPDLVKIARETALTTLDKDPTLAQHFPLKARLEAFSKRVHWE